ncbi:MAG: hypothetical protein JW934_21090 [Anaerolineae bacterium]|nr:hypothetical protein [Anaerolineae bacterium]
MLLLDGGDSLIGNAGTSVLTQGQSSVELYSKLSYDAMALGETDLLRLGFEILQQRIKELPFPVLSANAVHSGSGELWLQPYTIKEFQTHRVAIIGLTGLITTEEIIVLDPLQATRQAVDEVQVQADIIILLSHAGLNTNIEILNAIPEIDMIISGGGQALTSAPTLTENGRMVVHADVPSPGHAGRNVGVGRWIFDSQGQIADFEWALIALGPEIADDPDLAQWAQGKVP